MQLIDEEARLALLTSLAFSNSMVALPQVQISIRRVINGGVVSIAGEGDIDNSPVWVSTWMLGKS